MLIENPDGRLYCVDIRDGIACKIIERFNPEIVNGDGKRFFLVRAASGDAAIKYARMLKGEWKVSDILTSLYSFKQLLA